MDVGVRSAENYSGGGWKGALFKHLTNDIAMPLHPKSLLAPQALRYEEPRLATLCICTRCCNYAWERGPTINTIEVCSPMQTDIAVFVYTAL